jgi:hypothetical protein
MQQWWSQMVMVSGLLIMIIHNGKAIKVISLDGYVKSLGCLSINHRFWSNTSTGWILGKIHGLFPVTTFFRKNLDLCHQTPSTWSFPSYACPFLNESVKIGLQGLPPRCDSDGYHRSCQGGEVKNPGASGFKHPWPSTWVMVHLEKSGSEHLGNGGKTSKKCSHF